MDEKTVKRKRWMKRERESKRNGGRRSVKWRNNADDGRKNEAEEGWMW